MQNGNLAKNIRRVAYGLIFLLVLLFVHISYLQIIQSSFYAAHPLNRRSIEYSKTVARGTVFDRNGQKLAVSEKTDHNGFKRVYPYGALTAHLVGYDSARLGKAGLESSHNGYLSGIDSPLRGLGPVSRLFTRSQVQHIALTIDIELQKAADQALGDKRGAIVVLEPRSGAILAMVSKPGFDPNTIDSRWDQLSGSAASPLLNRATGGLYPPGSIIKPLIAEAGLTEHIVDLQQNFNCTGALSIGSDYRLPETNDQAHGEINLAQALAVSCNVTFGKIAINLGNTKIANVFARFGFNQSTGPDLQETASRLPEFGRLADGDLAQTGIGQGRLLVTPLRMALLAATFANHGQTMRPYLIDKIMTSDGTVIKHYPPEEWLRPTDAQIAQFVAAMMASVVENGTGAAARIAGTAVAGKTGTAENPHGQDHAWFIGFAPADNPRAAIAVIVENGGAGGAVAAPIARQVLIQALR